MLQQHIIRAIKNINKSSLEVGETFR